MSAVDMIPIVFVSAVFLLLSGRLVAEYLRARNA